MRTRLLSALLLTQIAFAAPMPAQAQSGSLTPGKPYDVHGTVVSITDNTMDFLTSDITGWPAVIQIDVSNIRVSNIRNGDSLTLTVGPRLTDIPLAWIVVDQGSRTMETDFGARSEFETTNETAEVQNRPDDDEARAKQKHPKGKED